MRVLLAPDSFAGTLTAGEAARAIAEGWSRRSPDDGLDLAPMSDGGPGFLDVLHGALGGDLLPVMARDPRGEAVPGTLLVAGDTAYLEAAQACGVALVPERARDPERASSSGVGDLLSAALSTGVRRVVVGLGGTATLDGGAGLLAALGATARGGTLEAGAAGLAELVDVDVSAAREACRGVDLVAAADVDLPLLGLTGTAKTKGPYLGLPADRIQPVDAALQRLAELTDRAGARTRGAGAAGGLAFGLFLLGGRRVPGVDLVADAVRLDGRAARADLVVTGEGSFDFTSRSGTVPAGVAAVAARAARPCIALAGSVLVGAREMRALGLESAYSLVDLVGEEAAFADPAGSLAVLAERVARTWSV